MKITAFGRVIYADWSVVLLIAVNLLGGVGNLLVSISYLSIFSGVLAVCNLIATGFLFGYVGVMRK